MAGGKPGRPPSVDVYPGKRFGYCEVQRRVPMKSGPKLQTICRGPLNDGTICNKVEKNPLAYFTRKNNPKTNCGCQTYKDANPFPREKQIWHMMHVRTEDPTHVSYASYGGRGIKVCDEWNKKNPDGWKNFIAYMGGAPTPKHSIDRVNPNLGYQPFQLDGVTRQCRWATAKQQANNQRRHHEP